eukprot:CAMPEP_0116878092 /NCGR_PEP_ID=MMETSP0463-20121206/9834_1 /TAXON_ID=181622 /ORGANISM="Strombidinopsis sp, Strain SopsisLIS2011" /LENGTH=38 /DNA_ID= /DNA_START= /DNA_END= /DNA_ORIENTATION=
MKMIKILSEDMQGEVRFGYIEITETETLKELYDIRTVP